MLSATNGVTVDKVAHASTKDHQNRLYCIYRKETTMKKSTARPTAAQIQRNQAQADRKAAALARRADRAAGLESVTQQNARLYTNIGR